MATDTTFIPLEIEDLSTVDLALNGIDPTITAEAINARKQPISFEDGSLTISGITTMGNSDLISMLPNPNLENQLVLPQLQVRGTVMANDIILGSDGITKLISDNTGTYVYSDLSVSGIINNEDLQN